MKRSSRAGLKLSAGGILHGRDLPVGPRLPMHGLNHLPFP